MTTSTAFTVVKDPADVIDVEFRWSSVLGTDTIASHTVTIDDGLTEDSSDHSADAVTVWISGGVAGTRYDIVCQIVSVGGRTFERSMTIRVADL